MITDNEPRPYSQQIVDDGNNISYYVIKFLIILTKKFVVAVNNCVVEKTAKRIGSRSVARRDTLEFVCFHSETGRRV